MPVKIAVEAADRKNGMTLDELRHILDIAERHDLPGDTVLKAEVTFSGRIKKLTL